MPASSNPHAISQCASVGAAILAASIWPTSARQSVAHAVFRSLLIARAVSSLRSQTETNSLKPSAARAAWMRACWRPRLPAPMTAVRSIRNDLYVNPDKSCESCNTNSEPNILASFSACQASLRFHLLNHHCILPFRFRPVAAAWTGRAALRAGSARDVSQRRFDHAEAWWFHVVRETGAALLDDCRGFQSVWSERVGGTTWPSIVWTADDRGSRFNWTCDRSWFLECDGDGDLPRVDRFFARGQL